MKLKEIEPIKTNHSLVNIITPLTGIEYKQNKIRLGDNYAKIYTIIKYPRHVGLGWLAKISNIPNTMSTQVFEPSENITLIENVSKGINQNETIYDSSRDALTRKKALMEIDDGQELIEKVEVNGETVGYMTNMITVIASSEEELAKKAKRVEGILSGMKLKIRSLAYLSRESLQVVAPYHMVNKEITDIASRNVLMSDFIGGFPFRWWWTK